MPNATTAKTALGRLGIWSASVRFAQGSAGIEGAQEVEELGFPSLWMPGGIDGGILADLDKFLDATKRIVFATGIINIWRNTPEEVAAWWHGQSPERQARLILGLGVSHGPAIGADYKKPLTAMRTFIDGLDAGHVPPERTCIAALGPKMLELSAERTAGSHPYLVSANHTRFARETMGAEALLAPEVGVVLESDAEAARAVAAATIGYYIQLPNYYNNWKRDGFSDEDIKGLAPHFVDAIVAWGDVEMIRTKLDAHYAAGADHVCVQVLNAGGLGRDVTLERPSWKQLAALL